MYVIPLQSIDHYWRIRSSMGQKQLRYDEYVTVMMLIVVVVLLLVVVFLRLAVTIRMMYHRDIDRRCYWMAGLSNMIHFDAKVLA